MHLDSIRAALARQLDSKNTLRTYLSGRSRHEALSDFATPRDALTFLGTRDPGERQRRSAVVAAMIAEAQRRETGTWSVLLTLAFFPGLLRLRATLRPTPQTPDDELNALVVECFLEAVGALPLATQGAHAVVNLTLNTKKLAWQHLAREAARAAREEPLPDRGDTPVADPCPSPEEAALNAEAARELEPARVRAWARDLLDDASDEDLRLVLDSQVADKPLIDWVRDRAPHLGNDALEREYGRLRRRRARLLERLRDRLARSPLSHRALREALLMQAHTPQAGALA